MNRRMAILHDKRLVDDLRQDIRKSKIRIEVITIKSHPL